MTDMLDSAYAACRAVVTSASADRSVALAFAPPAAQAGLAALNAFDLETAQIRSRVSQPLPGEIRLHWWRDVLAAGAAGGEGAPLAQALIDTVTRHDLPGEVLQRFLDARIFDLYNDPMPSRTEFEAYAGETRSTLIMLSAMVLVGRDARSLADAAGHAGVAWLATDLLRDERRHRALGQVFVPGDILAAAGTDAAAFLRGEGQLEPARLALCAYARQHLAAVRSQLAAVPRAARPAFLPVFACAPTLDAVEGARGAIGAAERPIGPFRRTWLYWRAMRS